MKPGADWLAWTLQCLVGMVAGTGFGFYAISDFGRPSASVLSHALEPGQLASSLWGAALIGGALASHFGDQLWLRSAYLVLQPDAPRQSLASRLASLWLGLIGVTLIASAFPSFHTLF